MHVSMYIEVWLWKCTYIVDTSKNGHFAFTIYLTYLYVSTFYQGNRHGHVITILKAKKNKDNFNHWSSLFLDEAIGSIDIAGRLWSAPTMIKPHQ